MLHVYQRVESIHKTQTGFFVSFLILTNNFFSSFKPESQEKYSLEIWAVKRRFLLIYENMLKSIATSLSECTTKHENKSSKNADYIVSDLIDFFGDD